MTKVQPLSKAWSSGKSASGELEELDHTPQRSLLYWKSRHGPSVTLSLEPAIREPGTCLHHFLASASLEM